ncbi:hypothetical protein ABN763_10125 [Spongiivirga sp. MCCC 1A20706]|uniref:hypothetical protein n=1 Tax=Spongiivirga sp. MCCC 1A20706 TaxID=3160963 RepID=UPI00397799F0
MYENQNMAILTSVDGSERFRYPQGVFTDSLIKSMLFNRYCVLPLASAMNSLELHYHIDRQKKESDICFVEQAIREGWLRPTLHERVSNNVDLKKYLEEKYKSTKKSSLPSEVTDYDHYEDFCTEVMHDCIEKVNYEYLTKNNIDPNHSSKLFLKNVLEYIDPDPKRLDEIRSEYPQHWQSITNVLADTAEIRKSGLYEAMNLMQDESKLSRSLLIGEIGRKLGNKNDKKYDHPDYILGQINGYEQRNINSYKTLFKWINRAHHRASASTLNLGINIPKFSYKDDFVIHERKFTIDKAPMINPFEMLLSKKNKIPKVLLPTYFQNGFFDNGGLVQARKIEGEKFFDQLDTYEKDPSDQKAKEELQKLFSNYANAISKSVKISLCPSWLGHWSVSVGGLLLSLHDKIDPEQQFAIEHPLLGMLLSSAGTLMIGCRALQTFEKHGGRFLTQHFNLTLDNQNASNDTLLVY